jgi:carbamoyltransferase
MIILGISDNHDSGACLIRDGEIISAINEERLSRKKLIGGFPYLSVQKVIEEAGINPQEIDFIVLASVMTPSFCLRMLENFHDNLRRKNSSFSYLLNMYIIYQVLAYKLKVPELIEKYLSSSVIKQKIKKLNIKAPVICIDHHYAHAACAYYTQENNKETLIFTMDAMGDALSATVNVGRGNNIQRIFYQTGFSSVSTYYLRLTEFLGFQPTRHEGKITSLAGYGKADKKIMDLARKQLRFIERKEGFNFINHFIKTSINNIACNKLKEYSKEDVAYNFQKNFEQEIVSFIEYWVRKTGIFDVNLSGGAFANVSLNEKISKIQAVKSLYIFPHMGDGGLALGAALSFLKPNPSYFKNIYLGTGYDNSYIGKILATAGIKFSFMEEENICVKIAEILFEGKVVAHFDKRMEYGPRALGNRSILYKPDDPTIQGWLNDRLQRSYFMPFAPVTLDKEARNMYLDIDKIIYTLRFMNVAVDCTREMKEKCPGAIHVDGTARPQILHREDNPRIYKILEKYQDLKGMATIINTSFNKHEEPIVCSPEDAIKSFLGCDLDYLVLNNFLVWKG